MRKPRRKLMKIHVWNHNQKVPAALYGDATYGRGNYKIIVSKNAALKRDQIGGIVYNF